MISSKRIQYTYDDEPSSLTIKNSLFSLLKEKKGSDTSARKFCQSSASEAKEKNINSISHYVFEKAFKETIPEKIKSQMKESDFDNSKVNERIQYTYEEEASSLTIKYPLFKALSIKLKTEKDAKKFCQKLAIEAKDNGVGVGKISNYVFDHALKEICS